MNEEQQRIWDYLVQNAIGKRNAVHINKIASDLGIPDYGTNNDDVRASIADMVIDKGQPIGTCREGAFLITNELERDESARFLDRNTRSTAIHRNGFYTPE